MLDRFIAHHLYSLLFLRFHGPLNGKPERKRTEYALQGKEPEEAMSTGLAKEGFETKIRTSDKTTKMMSLIMGTVSNEAEAVGHAVAVGLATLGLTPRVKRRSDSRLPL